MLDFSVTFIITIINITILFLILRKLLFKPVTKFMETRARGIQNSIEQAEKDKTMAQKMVDQYQNMLKHAEEEADRIVKAAHEQAEADSERIIFQGKMEAESITDTARARLETDRMAAMALFKAEAAALVLTAAGRLIGRELSGPDQERFAAETLDKIVMESGKRNG